MEGVLSNSTTTFNTWLRTRHIGTEMQKQVKEIMNLKTSSSHRESTPFGIRKHAENVKKLIKKMHRESFNSSFSMGQPVQFRQEKK